MTLPKKGSRRITVDGVTYRWAIRKKPTYGEYLKWGGIRAVVELFDSPESILAIDFPFARPDAHGFQNGHSVTPAMIAESIRQSVSDGWDPSVKGTSHTHEPKRPPAYEELDPI